MKRSLVLSAILALLLASPAHALFINGGFETGNTTGWTISGDHSVISSFTNQWNPAGWDSQIPYYGNYSLLLGSGDVGKVFMDGSHKSTASQTSQISQADIDSGLHLYFRWGAILEEPTNGPHIDANQPYFSIVLNNLTQRTTIYQADHRANESGFSYLGTSPPSASQGNIWYGTDVADLSLAGANLGDNIRLSLYVQDCLQGGHGGLVFLDGFGTTRPVDKVPEPGTLLLMGSALVGLATFRKRISVN